MKRLVDMDELLEKLNEAEVVTRTTEHGPLIALSEVRMILAGMAAPVQNAFKKQPSFATSCIMCDIMILKTQ